MSNTALTQAGLFGIGQGVGAGMWTLVGRYDVASTLPSSDGGVLCAFSNLNGNLDKRYALVTRVNYVSNAGGVYHVVNDDTGMNYPSAWLSGGGNGSASAGASAGGYLPSSGPRGSTVTNFATAIFDAAAGGLRHYRVESQEPSSSSGFNSGYYETICCFWNNTTDNVTKIDWRCSKANCVGAGSYVELWKLGPPPPIALGEWTLVERWEPAVAAATHLFSGLNGNVDRRYKIVARMLPGSGNNAYYYAHLQSDATIAHYQRFVIESPGTGPTASTSSGANETGLVLGYADPSGVMCFSETMIDAKSGVNRTYRTHVQRTAATAMQVMCFFDGLWLDTSTNITNIQVDAGATTFGVGSYIELWKLAQ